MDRLKELKEAIYAVDDSLEKCKAAIGSLKASRNWSYIDLFGNGMFSSFIKRNKIKDSNVYINDLQFSLVNLKKELLDVDIKLPNKISDTGLDVFFDVIFDNIFTDISVHSRLKNTLKNLYKLNDILLSIKNNLESEIQSLS